MRNQICLLRVPSIPNKAALSQCSNSSSLPSSRSVAYIHCSKHLNFLIHLQEQERVCYLLRIEHILHFSPAWEYLSAVQTGLKSNRVIWLIIYFSLSCLRFDVFCHVQHGGNPNILLILFQILQKTAMSF